MISPSKVSDLRLGHGDQTNNKHETTTTSSTAFESLERVINQPNEETENLREKLSQAEFTVDQLQNMIKTTAIHINQLAAECQKRENECAAIREEKRCQTEYEFKEINALEAELEDLKKTLEIRNEDLENAYSKNANLKNAIIANRYKIFHMHFNGLEQDLSEQSESSSKSLDSTSENTDVSIETTTVESSELSDET